MKADTITMRVNPDLKRQAEALCNDMGFTLSTAYTMLLKAIVRTRTLPFPLVASQRCLYLIQSNDSRDFEHPRVHFNRCCTDWLSS